MGLLRTRSRCRRVAAALALAFVALAAACGDGDLAASADGRTEFEMVTVPLGDRPFRLGIPSLYTPDQPMPLLVALHGYTSSPDELDQYLGLSAEAERRGFLLALPMGSIDNQGETFWNATDGCCDFWHRGVDDSAYLRQLIDAVKSSYAVDAERVWFMGHSNGGYMSHRMACDHADQISAIASFAGATWKDPARCQASRPVSVLQIHGTKDPGYLGDSSAPGAEATVARWRDRNGCAATGEVSPATLDLDAEVTGPETTVTVYAQGCREGTSVVLWRMDGSDHVPEPTPSFTQAMMDFFFAATRA